MKNFIQDLSVAIIIAIAAFVAFNAHATPGNNGGGGGGCGVGQQTNGCGSSASGTGIGTGGSASNANDIRNVNTATGGAGGAGGSGTGIGVGTGGQGGSASSGAVSGSLSGALSGSSSGAQSGASATNSAGASASSGSTSSSSSDNQSYNALTTQDNSKFYSFGAPASTAVPTAHTCMSTNAMAWSATILSYSQTKQGMDVACTLVLMADKAERQCQYQSATLLQRRALKLLDKGMDDEMVAAVFPDRANLSAQQCAELGE